MSETTETFRITPEAAEVYEAQFVPALFADWSPHTVRVAGISAGARVLDVACGTGIVARTAADQIGPATVTGVDANQAMLDVAHRVRPEITWTLGVVDDLPFDDDSFDAVLCQMAMMFFPDRANAVRQMARVAAPSGRVVICVPTSLRRQPAYEPFVDLVVRQAGADARSLLSTYFASGDVGELCEFFHDAGLSDLRVTTRMGTLRTPSIEAFVRTEVEGSPLVDRLDEDTYARIRAEAESVLAPFVTSDGRAEVPIEGHLLTGTTP
jgi:ubiquinone/menaquinone biosynthesis C-methylase UbiE